VRPAGAGDWPRDPDEATLHLLLGDLQARAGLSALAAQSYEEADYLLKR
jgi:hypothetical protein